MNSAGHLVCLRHNNGNMNLWQEKEISLLKDDP
jgi:hypothetical protein